jgi:hypothetical protein
LGRGFSLFHVTSGHIPGVGIGDVGEIVAQEQKDLPLFVYKEDAAAVPFHKGSHLIRWILSNTALWLRPNQKTEYRMPNKKYRMLKLSLFIRLLRRTLFDIRYSAILF